MPQKRPQEPAVFYVERPAPPKKNKKSLNYEPSDDKRTHTGEKAPKKQHTAARVGPLGGSKDHSPEKRAPPAKDQADPEAARREASSPPPETSSFHDTKKEPQNEGSSGGKAAGTHAAPAHEEAPEQGPAEDETGQAGSGKTEGRKRPKAPLSDERKAQLEAARVRATEVRKERAEIRRKERQLKEDSFLQTKRDIEATERSRDRKQQSAWYSLPEKIPDPLPKKQPARYVSPEYQGELPKMEYKTTEDTAAFPPVVELPGSLKRYADSAKPEGPAVPSAPVPVPPKPSPEKHHKRALDSGYDSEEEEKSIRKKRRQLERKRLEREEAEMDSTLQERSARPMVQEHPRQVVPPSGYMADNEKDDVLYKNQLNKVKRAMLMESIFGGLK